MERAFDEAIAFNQPLDAWDTSKVTNMDEMFYKAAAFNQLLDKWDTSKVTSMEGTFARCLTKWSLPKLVRH